MCQAKIRSREKIKSEWGGWVTGGSDGRGELTFYRGSSWRTFAQDLKEEVSQRNQGESHEDLGEGCSR